MTIAYSSIGAVTVTDNGASTGTTASGDTTGCTGLIAACIQKAGTLPVTVSDSKANTWTRAGSSIANTAGTPGTLEVFYCKSPTVGTGHTVTFTNSAGSSRYTGVLIGCTASDQTAFFDNWDTGKVTATATPFLSNSYTPSSVTNGVLLLKLVTCDAATETAWTENSSGTVLVSSIFGPGFPHSAQAAISAQIVTSSAAYTASFTDGSSGSANYAAAIYGFLGTSGAPLLTGQTATFSQGSMTVVTLSPAVRSNPSIGQFSPPVLGAKGLPGPLAQGLFQSPRPAFLASSGVSLGAQTASFSQGVFSPSSSSAITLTGQTATWTAGTLSPNGSASATLTGQTATFSQNQVGPPLAGGTALVSSRFLVNVGTLMGRG